MQLKNIVFASAALAVSSVNAADFTNSEYGLTAGQPFTLTWEDLSGTATITLKYGNALDLSTAGQIASGLTGTSFTYTPPASLAAGVAYAFQIDDGSGSNYSPQFQVSQATGTLSAATSAAASSSAASSTGATTSTGTTTGTSVTSVTNTVTVTTSGTPTGTSTETSPGSSTGTTTDTTSDTSSTGTSKTGSTTSTKASKTTSASATSSPTKAPDSSAVGLSSPLAFVFLAFAAIALH